MSVARLASLLIDGYDNAVYSSMLFIQQIPNLEGYLASVLDVFFKVQRTVITEIERMKVTEEQQ